MNTTQTLLVDGMTCDHCIHAVTTEVSGVAGVTGVTVDLRPGRSSIVTVTSSAPVPEAELAAALDEAGYDLHQAAS